MQCALGVRITGVDGAVTILSCAAEFNTVPLADALLRFVAANGFVIGNTPWTESRDRIVHFICICIYPLRA